MTALGGWLGMGVRERKRAILRPFWLGWLEEWEENWSSERQLQTSRVRVVSILNFMSLRYLWKICLIYLALECSSYLRNVRMLAELDILMFKLTIFHYFINSTVYNISGKEYWKHSAVDPWTTQAWTVEVHLQLDFLLPLPPLEQARPAPPLPPPTQPT